MHGVNLDLLHTTRHHLDGRPKDPHAHHRAELLAARRAARLERRLASLAWALRACWRAWDAGYVPMVSLGILLALEGFMVHSLSENFFDARAAVERTRLIVWMILAATLVLDRLPQSRVQNPTGD